VRGSGKLVGRPAPEARPEPEAEARNLAGTVLPGTVTTFSTSASDPGLVALNERSTAMVAAMQARIDARYARRRDLAVALATARARLGLKQSEVAALLDVQLHVVSEAEKAGSLALDRVEALLEGYRAIASHQAPPRQPRAQSNGRTRAAHVREKATAAR
jgi:ribosome-binding protein aMBF1 (putative translation factor)